MTSNFIRKKLRALKRKLRNPRFTLVAFLVSLVITLTLYSMHMQNRQLAINPESATPLLDVIGRAESKGNYNAYYGNAANTSVKFTDMTIGDVMKWQRDFVQQGSLSSAVGKYQIIDSTLAEVVDQAGIGKDQKFDETTQDQLALVLLERRGANEYVSKELTREQFAHNLAKEWAGLPKVIGDNPGDSYYSSDGINKSRVSVEEVIKAIEPIKPR